MAQVIHGLMGMALWGSIASVVVLMVRPFIKKRSNRITCLLWIVVMFRFLCPFAIESPVPVMLTENTQTVSSDDTFGRVDDIIEKAGNEADAEAGRYQRSDRNEGYRAFGNAGKENTIGNLPGKAGNRFANETDEVPELALGGADLSDAAREGSAVFSSYAKQEGSAISYSDEMWETTEVMDTGMTQMTGETLAYDDASVYDASAYGATFASDRANDDGKIQESSSVTSVFVKAMAFVKRSLESARAQLVVKCFGIVWILGAMLIMVRGISKYYGIAKALNESVFLRKWGKFSVRISEVSGVPMAFGILHPGIYVPLCFEEEPKNAGADSFSDRQKDMILWHESMHLRRLDPLWKMMAFVMAAIHWWNPLAWICVKRINQDIEMACDEMVLERIGQQNKEEYAKTLFGFATRQSGISFTASFGESHAESRIKNVLKYRRSPLWITMASLVFAFALGGCLALKPVAAEEKRDQEAGEERNITDPDAAEIEEDQETVSSETLWVKGGEDCATTFPLGQEEASLRIYSNGRASYYVLEKNGINIGRGTLVKWYQDESTETTHYEEYPVYEIDEIGYADINFDQVNDLILIGETQKGKCVCVVESKDGILDKEESDRFRLTDMDQLSNSVEELLGERPTVKGVKDALFGKDYDGTFPTYQDAYEVVARIENMKDCYTYYDLIYFNDDDIPDLVAALGYSRLYLFEDGKVYYSDVMHETSPYDGHYIERQSIAGPGDYVSEGKDYDYLQMEPDHSVRKVCGYRVESKEYGEEAKLTYLDYSDGKLSQDEVQKKIEGYQKEQKEVFRYEATYGELLYRLGKLPDVHESISSYVKIADTPHTIDHQGYTKAYMKIIDDMTLEYPGNKLTYDLIYFNDDCYPDLVVDYSGSWISLYVYEDGAAINVWDKKEYNTEECSKYTYMIRCNLIIPYARSKKTEGKAYIVKAGKKTDMLSYVRSEKYYDENDEYTFEHDMYSSTQWYLNDKEITRNEVENMIRDHGDACIYYGEVLLCGVESADAIKKRLASEMNHKELDIVVSQDSLYERFKNDDEKVYFNRYDGRTVYGPNFDLEKGYALSELIDTVWIHYKEEHLEYSPECTTMLLDFAYLDCGQDGDPEMAIEFKNVGIYGAGDDSTLVLVIKEINGKLQCTYGDETWGRSGGVINSAGIMFSMGNHGAGQDGYALGILDANAEYHWVYGVDTSDFNTAYDFFSCEDGYKIFECDADINNEQYKFFVSNDPKISDNALFSTMHKKYAEYADIKSAKEVARIREQAKESYGITEEMLWLDPLFESSYCSYISGNPLEMVNYVSGKALGWD